MNSKETGVFGIFPRGPIRDALLSDGSFRDRRLYGIVASSPEEIRGFRRSMLSSAAMAVFLSAYLGTITARLPMAP